MKQILVNARKKAEKLADLNEGIWYGSDYIAELKRWNQTDRINWFKDKKIIAQGFAPVKHFTRKGTADLHFIAKKTANASEALMAAIQGFGIYDCGMVCQIARYRALERVLGTEKFQRLFDSQVTGAAMNIGYLEDDELQPMRLFVDFPLKDRTIQPLNMDEFNALRQPGRLPVKEGQLAFIVGEKNYRYKHPHGDYASFNLICSEATHGQQKFLGFGLNPEGEPEVAIYQKLIQAYNKRANTHELLNEKEYHEIETGRKLYGHTTFDDDHTDEVLGFMPDGVQDFKISTIWKLIHTPTENIKPALAKNYPD
jgi:hypothetical protein